MTTSFFPAKPLGCYGDGGAIFTNSSVLKNTLVSLRNHGCGKNKYDNVRVGLNSRLDTLQAAILLEKLRIFPEEILARNKVAELYINELDCNYFQIPYVIPNALSTWAQFTISTDKPDDLAIELNKFKIPTAKYYPCPIHLQPAYLHHPKDPSGLPNTETLMKRVISIPIHAYINKSKQINIIQTINSSIVV